jgi:NADH dehydrogenase (ubiquinone) 1 alpha subcomplex subunit 10
MDKIYINPYGYDMRQLDPQLPKDCRSFDLKNFLADPHHKNVAQFQIRMYMLRYEAYIDALAHVLSTGQGVVLERSCYSDFVFLETMVKHGYISRGGIICLF